MFFKMCLIELLSNEYIEKIPFELEYFSRMGKTIDMCGGVKGGFVDASSVLCVLFVARQGRRLGGQSETDRRCPFACEKRTNERTDGVKMASPICRRALEISPLVVYILPYSVARFSQQFSPVAEAIALTIAMALVVVRSVNCPL